MSNRFFRAASRLVDTRIYESGETVTCEERNKRVEAVEYHLRRGLPENQIDTRARLVHLSVAGLLSGTIPLPTPSIDQEPTIPNAAQLQGAAKRTKPQLRKALKS